MIRSEYVACEHCDLLLDAPVVEEGQRALCPGCGHIISHLPKSLMSRLAAYGVTALILLTLSNTFSLLSFNLAGNISEISLWQSAFNLYFDQYKSLSILVFVFIAIIPAIIICLMLVFLTFIKLNRRPKGLSNVLRLLFGLMPWAMAEVFLVGVLVSLVKLVTIAQMDLGYSFWAYVLFCICYVKVLSLLDRYQMWCWLEGCRENVAV